jgi:hypothetical protein
MVDLDAVDLFKAVNFVLRDILCPDKQVEPVDFTSSFGCGSGHSKPVEVCLPLGVETNALAGTSVGCSVAASVGGAAGSVGFSVAASVGLAAAVGCTAGACVG